MRPSAVEAHQTILQEGTEEAEQAKNLGASTEGFEQGPLWIASFIVNSVARVS
jgi:hypothetical protein